MRRIASRPSLWLPPIVIAFSVYAAQLNPIQNARPETIGSSALQGMVFIIGALSVCAAWDALRFHGVAKLQGRRRNLTRLLVDRLWPLWMWSMAAFAILSASQSLRFAGSAIPHRWTILLAMVLGIVWPTFGFALGWTVPRVLALVLAAIVPFTVTSFAWSLSDFRWRHMFGVPTGCCTTSATISSQMVVASVLCLGSIAVASIAAVGVGRGAREVRAARMPVALGLVLVATAAAGLMGANSVALGVGNYVAQAPRSADDMTCDGNVCHWPESLPEQIPANRAAFDMVRASMPPEWLPDAGPVITPGRQFRFGAVDLSPEEYGAVGDPLPFAEYTDHVEIYRAYVDTLFRRIGRDDTTNAEAGEWWQWASQRTSPATPEEVFAWIDSKTTG